MPDRNQDSNDDQQDRIHNNTDDVLDTPEDVLTPSELDVSDEVTEIESGRTVVPTDGPASQQPHVVEEADSTEQQTSATPEDGHHLDSEAAYAVVMTIQTPNGTETTLIETNDVRELFHKSLAWHVSQIAPDTDPKEALRTLIQSSSLFG